MLSVIGNWAYVGFTTFILGYGFSLLLKKLMGYRMKSPDSFFVAGLIIATVYAQYFSLVYRVSAMANLLLVAGCMGIIWLSRKKFLQEIKSVWSAQGKVKLIGIIVLFVIWSFLGCQGITHYDTDLYHAQSIRWIEEYGVVKGLANLHMRLAYNSSLFAVTALYSMKFLLGRSLHDINGWMAFLLSCTVLDLGKAIKRKKLLLSDYACVAAIYYLTMIYEEVISPASDYATMCMVFYIVIKWLRQLESNETKEVVPYGLLCVVGVYTMTLKLTAGLLLILTIKPAYMLLKEKKKKEIAFFLSSGVLVAVPWMLRTIIISGWMFYPFAGLDLFSVDWKIPAADVVLDALCIKAWGRGIYNAYLANMPLTQWWPNWFLTELSGTEKLVIIADLATLLVVLCFLFWAILCKKKEYLDVLLVLVMLECCYLFWQWSAPLPRYGYAYMLLPVTLAGGFVMQWFKRDFLLQVAVVLFCVYKFIGIGQYAVHVAKDTSVYGWQLDYPVYEVQSFEVDGQVFYSPAGMTDQTGYYPFPATIGNFGNFKLRGDSLKDGFLRVEIAE